MQQVVYKIRYTPNDEFYPYSVTLIDYITGVKLAVWDEYCLADAVYSIESDSRRRRYHIVSVVFVDEEGKCYE